MKSVGLHAGERLRARRSELGLSLRDVIRASEELARKHANPQMALVLSRISDIETKGVLPNIHRIYAIAAIYRCSITEIFSWYDLNIHELVQDQALVRPPRTHLFRLFGGAGQEAKVPVKVDPSFDIRKSSHLGRMIQRWGVLPLSFLETLMQQDYSYAYIGIEDFTMYPLLLPGSFVMIDEHKNRVTARAWPSECQRPIYFIEMREGVTCCWCQVDADKITLQPHPLSPVPARVLKYPQEAEIVGQVVGLAMRLDGLDGSGARQPTAARPALRT